MAEQGGVALLDREAGVPAEVAIDLADLARFLDRWGPTREDRNCCRSLLRLRRLSRRVALVDRIEPMLRGPLRRGRISREGAYLLLRAVGALTWRQVEHLSAWSASGFVARRAAEGLSVGPASFSKVLSTARRRLAGQARSRPALEDFAGLRAAAGKNRSSVSPLKSKRLQLASANS